MRARVLTLATALGASACGFAAASDDGGVDLAPSCDPCLPETIADTRANPQDIVVRDGYVYWVDEGTSTLSGRDGKVLRAPITGCAGVAGCPTILADNVNSPAGVALAPDGLTLYFSETFDGGSLVASGRIWQIVLETGKATIIAQNQDRPRKLALGADSLFWIDGASGELWGWYTDNSLPPARLVMGLESPVEITVQPATSQLVWTNYGVDDFSGVVMHADLTGQNATVIADLQHSPRGVWAAPTYIYWTEAVAGTLRRALLDGSGGEVVASDLATPNDVLVDGDWTYWAEGGTAPYYQDGRVVAQHTSGRRVVLADTQVYPRSLAADVGYLYWVDRGTQTGGRFDGAVMRAGKPQ